MAIETGAETPVDGRRARRDRNRAAVIDALFSLIDEGEPSPSPDKIAARADVSVSSLFRYFDGLDDLRTQVISAHFHRFGPLFSIPAIGEGSGPDRIARFVDARLGLYASIAPFARLARARALDHARLASTLAEIRELFTEQIEAHFAPELDALTAPQRRDTIDLIDALTTFEAWDLLCSTRGRSDQDIRRSWTAGVRALLRSAI